MFGEVPSDQAKEIDAIIDRLHSSDVSVRNSAGRELFQLGQKKLSANDGVRLLREARGTYPAVKAKWEDASTQLIQAAAQNPRSEYVPVILECYDKYNKFGKAAALELLSRDQSRKAALAYMQLLKTHLKTGDLPSHSVYGFTEKPRYGDILFPDFLGFAEQQSFRWQFFTLCLKYCEEARDARRVAQTLRRAGDRHLS